MEDVAMWRQRDPIKRLKDAMIGTDQISDADFLDLEETIRQAVTTDVQRAKESEYPSDHALFDLVYATVTDS